MWKFYTFIELCYDVGSPNAAGQSWNSYRLPTKSNPASHVSTPGSKQFFLQMLAEQFSECGKRASFSRMRSIFLLREIIVETSFELIRRQKNVKSFREQFIVLFYSKLS